MILLIFIIILSILVLIHEFGHFIMAKKQGVKVEEFGWGIPPRVIGKKIGETIYSINLLPFGGFVKLLGEDSGEDLSIGAQKDPHNFSHKTPLQKASVLVAGVAMNFMFGVVLYYIFFATTNFKTSYIPIIFDYNFKFGNEKSLNTVVTGFLDTAPISKSGVLMGEAITKIDDTSVNSAVEIRKVLVGKTDQGVKLTLLNVRNTGDAATRDLFVKPTIDEKGATVLGVYLSTVSVLSYDTPTAKVLSGFLHSYNIMDYSLTSFAKIIGLSVKTRDIQPVSSSVAGPVGIYQVVDGIINYSGKGVWLNLIDFIALMSLSLALVNILPFPALDGGRLVFVLIEFVRGGKRLNPELEARIHGVGMFVLMGLILLVTVKDIFF